MTVEIERKYLVDVEKWSFEGQPISIKQGYFPCEGTHHVRIRITNDKAYITIKSSKTKGMGREFEYEIPLQDGEYLLHNACDELVVEKVRYQTIFRGHLWEVDVFEGLNAGLVIAEVELHNIDEEFDLPPWVTDEVTDDSRYLNSNLVKSPYILWRDK